jgi:hypothetical protein
MEHVTSEFCLAYGAIIGVVVGIFKKLPFGIGKWIGKNPKTVAAVLSTVVALAPLLKGSGASIAEIAACVAGYFAGSIAIHESLLKPVGRQLFPS